MRLKLSLLLTAACGVGLLLAAESGTAPKAATAAPAQAAFDKAVKPLFDSTCSMCHSAAVASGGLNIEQLATVGTLSSDRDEWEKIAHRLQAGEMPPQGIPQSDEMKAQIASAVKFVQDEFKRADALVKP